jgi:hypothetical protein
MIERLCFGTQADLIGASETVWLGLASNTESRGVGNEFNNNNTRA